MTATINPELLPASSSTDTFDVRLPLLTLLETRQHTRLVFGSLALALTAAFGVRTLADWHVWQAVALVMAIMIVPLSIKWRADAQRFGLTAAVAGAYVTVQSLHTTEHITQWIQRHVLNRPLRASNGLLSPANAEWIHFVWNWLVLLTIFWLVFRGMRSWWVVPLVLWATAHSLEHTYLFVRYLQVTSELHRLGFDGVTAQGLPGVIGGGGWLDLNAGTRLDTICGLPFLTTANRLDAHAVWNTGEVLLLLMPVHRLLRAKVPEFARHPRLD